MTKNEYLNLPLKDRADLLWEMMSGLEDYAVILLDKHGTIINWNKGGEKIKGYSAEEIIGKNFRIFYTAEDLNNKLPEKLINDAITNGKATHEGWRIRKDGSLFWGSVVITAYRDESGTLAGFSKITRDLTERKHAEDDLRNSNEELERINEELSSFAYVASHDLQEPLRKIQTYASRIDEMDGKNLSPKSKEFFARMYDASMRMQTLIEDLLAYSRTSTAEKNFELVDLNETMRQVMNDLEERIREKNAAVICSVLPVITGIKFQLRQLMVNLIGNSLKFSREGTPVRISVQAEIVHGEQIKEKSADKRKSYHHIIVTDNGIGFEQEYSTRIFEVFQRLHGRSEYSGTGIGLSICKRIVENHHGFISAEGKQDAGAVFHIYIPNIQTKIMNSVDDAEHYRLFPAK